MACLLGYGGENEPNNFVNILHNKGVWTVVGFKQEIAYFFNDRGTEDTSDDIVITDGGAQFWITKFTEFLGEGYTVKNAEEGALRSMIGANIAFSNYTMYDYENNLIPADYLKGKILCGMDSCYIAGDENQVVKH